MTRFAPLAAAGALAALACEPSVPTRQNPQTADYALFDPSKNEIPLPNDLALQAADTTPGAGGELLRALRAAGGFPNDQEVPVTVDFVHQTIQDGKLVLAAPDLDFTSFVPCTGPGVACSLLFLRVDRGPAPAPIEVNAANYDRTTKPDRGTLSLRNPLQPPTAETPQGTRRWPAGARYILALRGGPTVPNGIRTADGSPIYAQPAMYLLTQGKDLTDPRNNGGLLTPAQAQQLELVRRSYSTPGPSGVSVFDVVSQFFPVSEIANLTTFGIAPSTGATFIETDASAGLVPLPFDLLLDRSGATPHVIFSESFGPAAAGLATLDGFSTTAMIIAQASAPLKTATIPAGVLLFDLSDPKNPVQVQPLGAANPGYVAQPTLPIPLSSPPVFAPLPPTVIGLQPAVLVPKALVPTLPSDVPLPPLKEATEYAVVVTSALQDAGGKPVAPSSTLALLFFQNPLFADGKSQLPGVSDVQAQSLEAMRTLLPAAFAKVPAGTTPVAGYTFRTQTITGRNATAAGGGTGPNGAIQLAALPYDSSKLGPLCAALGAALNVANLDCTKPIPGSTKLYTTAGGAGTAGTVASIFSKYGVETGAPGTGPGFADIAAIIETQIATINLLDPATGAFQTDPTKATPEVINVLIAVPSASNTNVPPCSGPLAQLGQAGMLCPPLVLFHHGLGGGRAQMLNAADAFAAKGAVVAAIDMAKHGDRSWCSQVNGFALSGGTNKDFECAVGTCVPDPALANQGDVLPSSLAGTGISATPGHCKKPDGTAGTFRNLPTLCLNPSSPSATCLGFEAANAGIPVASGDFWIGPNFFRLRDTVRQDIIDHSQLVQVLAPTPAAGANLGDVYNALLGLRLVVNPAVVYWMGQSLGAITGTPSAAANSRLSRAGLAANAGTLVDAFVTAPVFAASLGTLFAELGVDVTKIGTDPATAAKFLQTVNVAKWVVDPADPLNYAAHLRTDPLPDLLAKPDGSQKQSAKDVLGQIALCDPELPNFENELVAAIIGLAPPDVVLDPTKASSALGTVQWFKDTQPALPPSAAYPGGCSLGTPHGFFVDWTVPAVTSTAQADAADFLLTKPLGTPPNEQPTLGTAP